MLIITLYLLSWIIPPTHTGQGMRWGEVRHTRQGTISSSERIHIISMQLFSTKSDKGDYPKYVPTFSWFKPSVKHRHAIFSDLKYTQDLICTLGLDWYGSGQYQYRYILQADIFADTDSNIFASTYGVLIMIL